MKKQINVLFIIVLIMTSIVNLEATSGQLNDNNINFYNSECNGSQCATQLANKVGWKKENNTWSYYNKDQIKSTGWLKVADTWYYLDDMGVMQTGWTKVKNTWYYISASGAMQTGWTKVKNTWYYMNTSGAMQTGWAKVKNTWYYMNASGAMQTGWAKVKNTWYYMNQSGAMQSGWLKLSNNWYYLNSSGAMQTGWINVNGKSYFLKDNGVWESGNNFVVNKKSNEAEGKKMLIEINAERKRLGLNQLVINSRLQSASMIRAEEITRKFSHTRPDGLGEWTTVSSLAYGENIAMGYNSSTAANKGLFNSSGHYSNIISKRFNSVGLGSYIDSDGSKHWVQLFGQ